MQVLTAPALASPIGSRRTDHQITEAIERFFSTHQLQRGAGRLPSVSPQVAPRPAGAVRVRVADQVAYLTGTVDSAADKAHLAALATQAGARRVVAQGLHAISPAATPGCPDAKLAQTVRDTLRRDPHLRASPPLVQVHQGVVTLAGVVGNAPASWAAAQAAQQVPGVRQVRNLLKVRPADHRQPSDEAIAVGWSGHVRRIPSFNL